MNGSNDAAMSARQILEQPFPPEAIKTRPGSHGQTLSYVETHNYIGRLNLAYGGTWSFEICAHEVGQDEVLAVVKLVTPDCTKMAFGSAGVVRRKDSGAVADLGDSLKAAASDGLKKACSLLGCGLSMYGADVSESTPKNSNGVNAGNGTAKTNGGSANGTSKANGATVPANVNVKTSGNNNGTAACADDHTRLTSRQLSAILGIARDRGLDRTTVNKMSQERFGRVVEFLSKADASSFIGELSAS